MLPDRGLEVMEWEECYRGEETPWDLGAAAPPLLELLETRPAKIWGEGPVLVPGCGLGHDAAALQKSGYDVLGLDLAPSALAGAQARYGAEVSWLEGDFLDPELAKAHAVGAIFEHTCFCAIDPEQRGDYVEAAMRWLKPGGKLVGIFFLDPPRREDGEAGPPYRAGRDEIRNLFAGGFRILRELSPERTHPDREGREWVVEFVRML